MPKKSFKELREAACEVAETIGVSLDESCWLMSEEWGLDECYIFRFECGGVKLNLEVPDAPEHFEGTPE